MTFRLWRCFLLSAPYCIKLPGQEKRMQSSSGKLRPHLACQLTACRTPSKRRQNNGQLWQMTQVREAPPGKSNFWAIIELALIQHSMYSELFRAANSDIGIGMSVFWVKSTNEICLAKVSFCPIVSLWLAFYCSFFILCQK